MMFTTQLLPFFSLLAEVSEKEEFDPDKVSPGVAGFVVVAAIAVALFFLGFDLVRRLRRAKFRDEIQRELAAELAERDGNDALADIDAGSDAEPPRSDSDSDDDPRQND